MGSLAWRYDRVCLLAFVSWWFSVELCTGLWVSVVWGGWWSKTREVSLGAGVPYERVLGWYSAGLVTHS